MDGGRAKWISWVEQKMDELCRGRKDGLAGDIK